MRLLHWRIFSLALLLTAGAATGFAYPRTPSESGTGRPSVQVVPERAQTPNAPANARDGQASPGPIICTPRPDEIRATYDRKANRATFWVSHLGNIWAHPTEQIDEDDEVEVVVRAPRDLIPLLRVKRVSATRLIGGINIAGEFPGLTGARAKECADVHVVLSDFAPGVGQVHIVQQAADKEVTTGTFEFSVAALYDGYLSFAGVYTDATARTFKLAPSSGGTIILPGESAEPGDRDIRYAVFYTHFVWGKREMVKGPAEWYHRVNPTFGVTISELAEHFLYGVSIDLGAFTVGGGLHSSRQTILHPASGLEIGQVFTGEAGEIPTATDWTSKGYVALGVDMRAVVAMLKAAMGVGKFGEQGSR